MRLIICLLTLCLLLTGCSVSTPPPPEPEPQDNISFHLHEQLRAWRGTPYRYGGTDRKGIDCSAFVQRTYSDKFNINLPRSTLEQSKLGVPVVRSHLRSGDLLFFKTGSTGDGLHVGIYDTEGYFIHASTSQGVTRSSLSNNYWKRRYWQARRL